MTHKNARGNVLFLILLAIAIFGALTLAVRGSMRGGGKDAGGENAKSYAAEIMQYGNAMASTVARLQINNECEDTEISFSNLVYSGYTNATSPLDGRCHVFGANGGALSVLTVNPKWLDTYFSKSPWGTSFLYGVITFPSNLSLANIGTFTNGYAASTVDLVFEIPYLTNEICKAINTEVGMPYPLYATNAANGTITGTLDTAKFTGRFSSCAAPGECNYFATLRTQLSSSSPSVTPPPGFCVTGIWGYGIPESKEFNVYVHTLIAR